MARPQIHVCARCGKGMAYAEKWMLYAYKTQTHGRLEARMRVDLCEECARDVLGRVERYCAKGARRNED